MSRDKRRFQTATFQMQTTTETIFKDRQEALLPEIGRVIVMHAESVIIVGRVAAGVMTPHPILFVRAQDPDGCGVQGFGIPLPLAMIEAIGHGLAQGQKIHEDASRERTDPN